MNFLNSLESALVTKATSEIALFVWLSTTSHLGCVPESLPNPKSDAAKLTSHQTIWDRLNRLQLIAVDCSWSGFSIRSQLNPTNPTALKESFDSVYGWVEQVLEVARVSWNEQDHAVKIFRTLGRSKPFKRDTFRNFGMCLRLALVNWRLIRIDFFGPVDCQDRSRKEVILALVGNKVDLEAKTHSNVCVLCNFIHYFESWDNCSANLTLNSFWRWLWFSLHLRHLATRAICQVIQVLMLVSEFAKRNWAVFKTPFVWWLVQDYTNHYIYWAMSQSTRGVLFSPNH